MQTCRNSIGRVRSNWANLARRPASWMVSGGAQPSGLCEPAGPETVVRARSERHASAMVRKVFIIVPRLLVNHPLVGGAQEKVRVKVPSGAGLRELRGGAAARTS